MRRQTKYTMYENGATVSELLARLKKEPRPEYPRKRVQAYDRAMAVLTTAMKAGQGEWFSATEIVGEKGRLTLADLRAMDPCLTKLEDVPWIAERDARAFR